MTNNNSNFNYLDTLPTTTLQYQPQQSQQSHQIMTPFTMNSNGTMKNASELDISLWRFENDTRYQFDSMKILLSKQLDKHYKNYFEYLDTIKERRGLEEYLADLKKILHKLNENISKSERTIIKLKKTLDYSETKLPIVQQVMVNGIEQSVNSFSIPELQEIVEKDDNIEFVDVFNLKGKDILHISTDYKKLIINVIHTLMDFTQTASLYRCLKDLHSKVSEYPKENVSNSDNLGLKGLEGNQEYRPLVEIDIYSKLFDIFDKGSLNIKNIKTDKIEEIMSEIKIDQISSSSSSSSYSPYSYSPYSYGRNNYGGDGRPEYSFGGPKSNYRDKSRNQSSPSSKNSKNSKDISGKIKKILKYEINHIDDIDYELKTLMMKKGRELTDELFYNKNFIGILDNIRSDKNNISNSTVNIQPQQNSNIQQPMSGGKPQGQRGNQRKGQRSNQQKGQKGNQQKGPKILTGYQIIKRIKDTNSVNKSLKEGKIDDFVRNIGSAFKTKIKNKANRSVDLKKEKKNLSDKLYDLKLKKRNAINKKEDDDKIKRLTKEIENAEKEQRNILFKMGDILKYSEYDIRKVVEDLNSILKARISEYPKRIEKCGDESFGKETRVVVDFFTGMTDKILVKEQTEYKRIKKNDDKKSIEYIQMYCMMFDTYQAYYKTYKIEKIIKSFTVNTLQRDYALKMRILNCLGLYSVIIYRRLLIVREIINGILLQSHPDYEKSKTMLTKIQNMINSTTDEVKKEKLLKIRKNLVNEIEKFTKNKKNFKNKQHEKKGFDRNSDSSKRPWENKKHEKKGFDRNSDSSKRPWEKKSYNKYNKYKKSNNNNVFL
jgi:hypothetical protein